MISTMNGSPAKSQVQNGVPIIGDKITNGSPATTPLRKFQNDEEIWDRTPKISRMNSMECWDYTIELECLQGPQGFLYFLVFNFSHLIQFFI